MAAMAQSQPGAVAVTTSATLLKGKTTGSGIPGGHDPRLGITVVVQFSFLKIKARGD